MREELGEKTGVSRQTINSIETNRFVPSTVLRLSSINVVREIS